MLYDSDSNIQNPVIRFQNTRLIFTFFCDCGSSLTVRRGKLFCWVFSVNPERVKKVCQTLSIHELLIFFLCLRPDSWQNGKIERKMQICWKSQRQDGNDAENTVTWIMLVHTECKFIPAHLYHEYLYPALIFPAHLYKRTHAYAYTYAQRERERERWWSREGKRKVENYLLSSFKVQLFYN